MLSQHAGNVVVHDDDLVGLFAELHRKDADGGRPAAHAHALLQHTVDNRRATGLDRERGTAFDLQRHRLPVTQRLHHFHRDAAFLFAAAREVVHAAQRKHLRPILGRGDVTDDLAPTAHAGLLRSQIPIGVDLHLQAAITENAFGHDGDHVDPIQLRAHDEGRRLVVGVGRRRSNARHEDILAMQQVSIPLRGLIALRVGRREGNDGGIAGIHGAAKHHHGIDAHQHAVLVRVTIAGTGTTGADLAEHRAGIAFDFFGSHAFVTQGRTQARGQCVGPRRRQSIRLGMFSHRIPVGMVRHAGAAGILAATIM